MKLYKWTPSLTELSHSAERHLAKWIWLSLLFVGQWPRMAGGLGVGDSYWDLSQLSRLRWLSRCRLCSPLSPLSAGVFNQIDVRKHGGEHPAFPETTQKSRLSVFSPSQMVTNVDMDYMCYCVIHICESVCSHLFSYFLTSLWCTRYFCSPSDKVT